MITRQFEIVLDLKNLSTLQSVMTVTQNDKDVNVLIIKVQNGGAEIDYEEVDHGRIFFQKADKTIVQGDLEKASDCFVYQMGTNEIAYPGKVLAIVHLYGATGERIATAKFMFWVARDIDSEDAIKSSSHYAGLEKVMADLEQAFWIEIAKIVPGIEEDFNNFKVHVASDMPHLIKDVGTNKTYRYGLAQKGGHVTFIYEEVV